ncbi:MAG: hypothetical protein R3272_08325 [Candidatus Promineifilaceae bacterium]|nr:hypothetical protein [Candidatus Promineifilaceae bacterium]
MKLGEGVQIVVGSTEDLDGLAFFYEELGYKKVAEEREWVIVTDGVNRLLLTKAEDPYRSLTYYASDMSKRAEELDKRGILFIDRRITDDVFRATFYSPNQLPVTLIAHDPASLPEVDSGYTFPIGKFGELSIAVSDLAAALSFWEGLGFERLHESTSPYPWAILGDGLIVLGLHQSETFEGEALTYFDPDMPQHIAQMKAHGFTFKEEMSDEAGVVRNAVLETPAGQQIFLFEGEL